MTAKNQLKNPVKISVWKKPYSNDKTFVPKYAIDQKGYKRRPLKTVLVILLARGTLHRPQRRFYIGPSMV